MDDDGIKSGPALRREPSDVSDCIKPGRGLVNRGRASGRGRGNAVGRPREPPQCGTFACWLVGTPNPGPALEASAAQDWADPEGPGMCGVAMCEWRFVAASSAAADTHNSLAGGVRARGGEAWGYIQYRFINMWRFTEPQPVPAFDGEWSDPVFPAIVADELSDCHVGDGRTTARDVLDAHWCTGASVVLALGRRELGAFFEATTPSCFRSIRLAKRSDTKGVIPELPPLTSIARWRKASSVLARGAQGEDDQDKTQAAYERLLLELPASASKPPPAPRGDAKHGFVKRDIDPLIVINAVGFSRFLRSSRDFGPALNAAQRYENQASDDESREDDKDPKRSKLEDTMRRLDVMDLLLMRRKIHADALTDNILAINLYSDGSPVSGAEIQGMLCDIHRRNGEHERIELPGSNLSYGLFDSISKSACLLHAFWLIAGPDYDTLRYCLRKVVSITSDLGTEIHTLEMRDMAKAYCMYMEGADLAACRDAVNTMERWLPFAARLSGWSHTMGNIMLHTAESTGRWPDALAKMRTLVSFFRNATWREFIVRALEEHPSPDFFPGLLKHFSVSMAKWRYETITAAMGALLPLRPLCEGLLKQEWFANAKDKEELKAVFDACSDKAFW